MNILDDYKAHITNKHAPATIENHLCLLRMFHRAIEKDFLLVTQQDIDNYLAKLKPLTAQQMKSKLRLFYIWLGKPDVITHLTCNKDAYKPKRTDKDVLTVDEIERLIPSLPELQHKALLETFIVTGGRNTEVRLLNLGDIEEKDGIVWINLPWVKNHDGNTHRRIPICEIADNPMTRYPRLLLQLISIRTTEQRDIPVFISLRQRTYGKRVSSSDVVY